MNRRQEVQERVKKAPSIKLSNHRTTVAFMQTQQALLLAAAAS
jgi:hypothetical protein